MPSKPKVEMVSMLDFSTADDHRRQQPMASCYHFYIDDDIGPNNEIRTLIRTLKTAGPSDLINIYINTGGGRLDTCLQIIHSIQNTQALVICHADGFLYSGGSLVFFAGHQLVVNPHTHFMMHDASTFHAGKFNEIDKAFKSYNTLLYRLYHDVYEPYLTAEEVDTVLSGKDLYLDGDQVTGRIERALKEQEGEAATE